MSWWEFILRLLHDFGASSIICRHPEIEYYPTISIFGFSVSLGDGFSRFSIPSNNSRMLFQKVILVIGDPILYHEKDVFKILANNRINYPLVN